MNRIITISREFGSGGRELGKRLAGALGIPCYDHEIIEMIAKENGFNEDYVAHVAEKSIEAAYPLTIGHRFGMQPFQVMDQPIRVAVAQRQIVENFAKQGDCVIVGRAADVILRDYKPLNIFVYADKDSKVERCQRRRQFLFGEGLGGLRPPACKDLVRMVVVMFMATTAFIVVVMMLVATTAFVVVVMMLVAATAFIVVVMMLMSATAFVVVVVVMSAADRAGVILHFMGQLRQFGR